MRRDRYYNFNENFNVENLKFRTLQSLIQEQPLIIVVSFWRPSGTWVVWGNLFDQFLIIERCLSLLLFFISFFFLRTQDRESTVDSR